MSSGQSTKFIDPGDIIFDYEASQQSPVTSRRKSIRTSVTTNQKGIAEAIINDKGESTQENSSQKQKKTLLPEPNRQIIYEPIGHRRSRHMRLPSLTKMSTDTQKEVKFNVFHKQSPKKEEPAQQEPQIKVPEARTERRKPSKSKTERLQKAYEILNEVDLSPMRIVDKIPDKPKQKPKQILPDKIQQPPKIQQKVILESKPASPKMEKSPKIEQPRLPINFNYATLHTINIKQIIDRKEFLTLPIKQGNKLQLSVRRDKSGLGLFPQYDVFMSNEYRHIVSAKKQSGNTTSNYHISTSKDEFEPSFTSYIGKVRSNFMGSAYQIYDDGCNPEKLAESKKKSRKILASVHYESSSFVSKRFRKMEVYIRNPATNPQIIYEKDLKERWLKQPDNYIALVNKQPQWNESKNCYMLDYKGRVLVASDKNCIIAMRDSQNIQVMLFGKQDESTFSLDVLPPLSPLQAIGIMTTLFDTSVQ